MVDDTKASANAHTNTSDGTGILQEVLNQPAKWAVFFDIDGTLIDIADTPDGIVVPDDLAENLTRLSAKLSGAVALVTGRALPYADQLFKPHVFPIAGLHGAERRSMSGAIERVTPGPDFEALKVDLAEEATAWPGVLVEDKGLAVAAHYRQAPTFKGQVEAAMERYRERAGSDFTLQRGKMVVEIRPARASKGDALRAFLSEEPFAGRLPIAIGDDVTDEAMFRVANKLGGHSIRISDIAADTVASATLGSAAELRALIAKLAAA